MAKIMKKTVAILVLVLAVVSVQAQNLLSENFSSQQFPPGNWTLHTENPSAATWVRAGDGGGSAQVTAGNANNAPQRSMLITPAIEISNGGFYELNFQHRRQHNRGTWTIAVYVSTTDNDPESFTLLQTITPGPTPWIGTGWGGWTGATISLVQFEGDTIYLAFVYQKAAAQAINWQIDDVIVRPIPRTVTSRIPAVNAINVATDQTISASFNLPVNENSFEAITFSPTLIGDFTTAFDGNTLTISHDGFMPSTVYTVTLADARVGQPSISWSFRTAPACGGAGITVPFTENFDVVTFPNFSPSIFPRDCWRIHAENSTAATWVRNTAAPLMTGTSGHIRHVHTPNNVEQTSWFITEAIQMPETGTYELSFWTRVNGTVNNHAHMSVWISTTTNDISEFTELEELVMSHHNDNSWSPWEEIFMSLAEVQGDRIYLAFRYQSNPIDQASHQWDVGRISIEQAFTECSEPYDLNVVPTRNSALFSWSGDAPSYTLNILRNDAIVHSVVVFGNSHNVTGLPINTEHTWFVVASCGRLSSDVVWGEPFSTLPNAIKFSVTAFAQGDGTNLGDAVSTGDITILNQSDITIPSGARNFSATLEVNGIIVGTQTVTTPAGGFMGLFEPDWNTNTTRVAPTFTMLRMDLSEPGEHRVRIWLNSFGAMPDANSVAVPTDTFEKIIYNRHIDAGVVEIIAVVDGEYIVLQDDYDFINLGDADLIGIRVANHAANDIPQVWGSATIESPEGVVSRLHDGANQQFLPGVEMLYVGETMVWTFPNTVNFTAMGDEENDFVSTFEIEAWARGLSAAGPDLDPTNDTLRLTIRNRNVRDLHMVSINYPQSAIGLTTAEEVRVTVGNRGTWEITDASIELWLDDNLMATEYLPAILAGDISDFVFDATLDLSILHETYEIKVVIVYADDRVASNDTLRKTVTNSLGVVAKTPYPNEGTIARDATVFVTFSQNIVATELPIEGVTITYVSDGEIGYITNVEATLYGAILTIAHGGFAYETRYTVTIPAEAVPGYDYEISWSFTVIDEPPIVVATTPGTDAANITLAANVTVMFNRSIVATDVPLADITFYPEVADVRVFFADAALIIVHGGFSRGTTYTVTIPIGTVDRYEEIITWSFTTRADMATGIETLNPTIIAIFPNPVDDILHIETTEMVRRIEIYNAQGVLVMATENIANFIDVSPLPSGVYIIRFITDNGIVTQRFIKR